MISPACAVVDRVFARSVDDSWSVRAQHGQPVEYLRAERPAASAEDAATSAHELWAAGYDVAS